MSTPLRDRPELYDDLSDIFQAFSILSLSRQYNETGPQPIGYCDLLAYMTEHDVILVDERREFERLFRVLDGKYLQLSHEKMARDRERLMKQSSSSRGSKR